MVDAPLPPALAVAGPPGAEARLRVAQADGRIAPEPRVDVAHVANAIVQMANLPLEANILNMTIMASAMPFVGRG